MSKRILILIFLLSFSLLPAFQGQQSDSQRGEHALKWARTQVGKSVQPCQTKGCKYNETNPGTAACATPNPAPDTDDKAKGRVENGHPLWHFYCMRFVRMAYDASAQYPSAKSMYDALKQKGEIKTGKEIPSGALVFWQWAEYGHVGIYTNSPSGQVIHTGVNPNLIKNGVRTSSLSDITEVLDGYNKQPKSGKSYLGWACPPKDWPGRKD